MFATVYIQKKSVSNAVVWVSKEIGVFSWILFIFTV